MDFDFAVSHETETRLRQFAALVRQGAAKSNLVGRQDVDKIWARHVLDSAQLVPLLGRRRRILDLGSGAGFPGMVLAIMLPPEARVHLVEMRPLRLAFLREAAPLARAELVLHGERAEKLSPPADIDAITARALAPLPKLLALTARFFAPATRGFFFKGKNWPKELTQARRYWNIDFRAHPSRTAKESVILEMARPHPLDLGQDSVADSAHFRHRQPQRRGR